MGTEQNLQLSVFLSCLYTPITNVNRTLTAGEGGLQQHELLTESKSAVLINNEAAHMVITLDGAGCHFLSFSNT